MRLESLNAVVFSPAADGILDVARACGLIRKYSSIPFVAYVPLEATYMRAIARMAHDGLEDLVVQTDDAPPLFRRTLERVSSLQEVSALVDNLRPWLRRLPDSLVQILIDVLPRPHEYRSAEDIAAAAATTMSALYRRFGQAGVNSPKSFVIGARVFRGYLYLRDDCFSVRDVAAKLG